MTEFSAVKEASLVKELTIVANLLGNQTAAGLRHLEWAKKFVCFHQGAFIQYSMVASKYHKNLKNIFSETPDDKEAVESALKELVFFLTDAFQKAAKVSFAQAHEYFLSRDSQKLPARCCIKGCDDDHVVDYCREEKVTYTDQARCPSSENTGFNNVIRSGKQYIENDIPLAVKNHRYKNPRIRAHTLADYEAPPKPKKWASWFKKNSNGHYVKDDAWRKCWVQVGQDAQGSPQYPSQQECYKSTLIVPITLWGHSDDLHDVFEEMFDLREVNEPRRIIYGFLCFDHPDTEYFSDEDVLMGYIVADVLSLYMITQLNYTTNSSTYRNVLAKYPDLG